VNLERWTYRYGLIDGIARAGSIEFKGKRHQLPVILDPIDIEGRFRTISVMGGWEDVGIRLFNDQSPKEIPGYLRQAIENSLKDMGISSFYPLVSSSRSRLIGSMENEEAEMPIHVLPNFNITAGNPKNLLKALIDNFLSSPVHDPLFIPGVVDHGNLELLLYFGMEIFDTIKFRSDGVKGLYHTDIAPIPLDRLERMGGVSKLCNCSHCQVLSDTPPQEEVTRSLIGHNIEMMSRRISLGISALKEGRLREVVMGRLAGNPSWMSALVSIERSPDPSLIDLVPTYRKMEHSFVTYREDLFSPDFTTWRKRIFEDYDPIPNRNILLLLPCSAKKPYSTSRTHQRIRDGLKGVKGWRSQVQQVVITSPLGAVPMELEDLYPASYYDIPVTGDWYPEEIDVSRNVVSSIYNKSRYEHIICYHKEGDQFFPDQISSDLFKGATFVDIHTRAKAESVDPFHLLSTVLSDLMGPGKRTNYEKDDLTSLVRYSLDVDISTIPDLKIKWSKRGREMRKGKDPLIIFKKGGPIPTALGGKVLWELEGEKMGKRIFIDDFKPKGTIFSQGIVSISGRIRSGDVVLVGTEGEYRGVGRALVPGSIMVEDVPGPGVQMIHSSK
jgi:archaeosine synthase